jgi:hypothetical protein
MVVGKNREKDCIASIDIVIEASSLPQLGYYFVSYEIIEA